MYDLVYFLIYGVDQFGVWTTHLVLELKQRNQNESLKSLRAPWNLVVKNAKFFC